MGVCGYDDIKLDALAHSCVKSQLDRCLYNIFVLKIIKTKNQILS